MIEADKEKDESSDKRLIECDEFGFLFLSLSPAFNATGAALHDCITFQRADVLIITTSAADAAAIVNIILIVAVVLIQGSLT